MSEPLYIPLLKRYAEGIIYKPSLMKMREIEQRPPSVTVYVWVHNDDIGLLCGKGGRIIKALQQIFLVIGRRRQQHVRISVERLDEDLGAKPEPKFSPRPHWVTEWDKTPEAISILTETIEKMGFEMSKISSEEHHDTTVITIETNLPIPWFADLQTAIHAWGFSMGRHIFIARPDQVKTA